MYAKYLHFITRGSTHDAPFQDDDPFAMPEDKDEDAPAESDDSQQKDERGEKEGAVENDNSQHNTEREEKEEAATVAPEGTREAETQRKGENVDDVKNVG